MKEISRREVLSIIDISHEGGVSAPPFNIGFHKVIEGKELGKYTLKLGCMKGIKNAYQGISERTNTQYQIKERNSLRLLDKFGNWFSVYIPLISRFNGMKVVN